jgi:hypothetical protein
MQFAAWEPIYHQLLEDFGFSSARDEEGALLLAGLLQGRIDCLAMAERRVRGRDAVIYGNAPSLDLELDVLPEKDAARIAADGAAEVLLRRGIVPDILVSDLDGPFPAIQEACQKGAIIVVHAHGDNLDALCRYVPQLENVIGTCQCRPPEGLYNFGGFTDGDRSVFLASELGACSIELVGFDFEDQSVTPRKRKKLAWAERMIKIALAGRGGR